MFISLLELECVAIRCRAECEYWGKNFDIGVMIDQKGNVSYTIKDRTKIAHNELTHDEKQEKYRAGLYSFPAPPVHTTLWDENSWIKFVDAKGKWLT
jgi:hypothetical protein